MLHPPKMRPELARTAAPTRKFEKGAWAFSRACLEAVIKASCSFMRSPRLARRKVAAQVLGNLGNHCFKERHEFLFHAFCYFEHLAVNQRLIDYPGSRIGDARDAQNTDVAVTGGDYLRHRRHTHQVRSDGAEVTNFGRG